MDLERCFLVPRGEITCIFLNSLPYINNGLKQLTDGHLEKLPNLEDSCLQLDYVPTKAPTRMQKRAANRKVSDQPSAVHRGALMEISQKT
jgi:hypothetical protein